MSNVYCCLWFAPEAFLFSLQNERLLIDANPLVAFICTTFQRTFYILLSLIKLIPKIMQAKIVNGQSEKIEKFNKNTITILNQNFDSTVFIVRKTLAGESCTKRVGNVNIFEIDGFYDVHFESTIDTIVEYELS
jgi:hypothetical protein